MGNLDGEGLDLDALDRTRSDLAASLQRQGWYGFLGEHLAIDLDTTGSGQTGQVQATVGSSGHIRWAVRTAPQGAHPASGCSLAGKHARSGDHFP